MEILALNAISPLANNALGKKYKLTKDSKNPVAIMLRSFKMHDYNLPESVLCVGRCGAGTNNIPVADYANKGVVVFNTPGANANAVKELVIASLFLCGRKIFDGINWAQTLKGKGTEVEKLVESGKSDFVGGEILGKTLGVIGLGAIGVLAANAAHNLGMKVVGYDPYISVQGAWNLNHNVRKEDDLNTLLSTCDYISLHTPLNATTRGLIGKDAFKLLKNGINIINCSRGELVDNDALITNLKNGKVNRYVTDFPTECLLGVPNVIAIPHLGASTPEAEDNCAIAAANEIVDFIENGNIVNSVNFPACVLKRDGKQRITIIHQNVKNVISSITDIIGSDGINIGGFVSKSDGKDLAYAILDVDEKLTAKTIEKIKQLDTVIKLRVID